MRLLERGSKQHGGRCQWPCGAGLDCGKCDRSSPGETIWDQSLTGFGARRQKSDAVAYVVFYRTKEGRQRWFTIGKHGAPWTPETAREEARRMREHRVWTE